MSAPNTPCYVGVEVGPSIIRAGIYSSALRLIGKTKLSTKAERGAEAVIGRVARCVLYAADECDVPLSQIQAVGVGIPGRVNPQSGLVHYSTPLGWSNVSLHGPLEAHLDRPVLIANSHNLAALGILTQEVAEASGSLAAVFLGPQIGGAALSNGGFLSLDEGDLPVQSGGDLSQNVFATVPHALFSQFRSRDFRKLLRKGSSEARHYLLQVARHAGEAAAELVRRYSPERIAFGGGVLEEMRDDLLRTVRESARAKLGRELDDRSIVLPSGLGDLPGTAGGAALAARKSSAPATGPSVAFNAVH